MSDNSAAGAAPFDPAAEPLTGPRLNRGPEKGSLMVEATSCARMIIAAKTQAYEEAIRVLEMVEKFGARALPVALTELRAKHAALASTPRRP